MEKEENEEERKGKRKGRVECVVVWVECGVNGVCCVGGVGVVCCGWGALLCGRGGHICVYPGNNFNGSREKAIQ